MQTHRLSAAPDARLPLRDCSTYLGDRPYMTGRREAQTAKKRPTAARVAREDRAPEPLFEAAVSPRPVGREGRECLFQLCTSVHQHGLPSAPPRRRPSPTNHVPPSITHQLLPELTNKPLFPNYRGETGQCSHRPPTQPLLHGATSAAVTECEWQCAFTTRPFRLGAPPVAPRGPAVAAAKQPNRTAVHLPSTPSPQVWPARPPVAARRRLHSVSMCTPHLGTQPRPPHSACLWQHCEWE